MKLRTQENMLQVEKEHFVAGLGEIGEAEDQRGSPSKEGKRVKDNKGEF